MATRSSSFGHYYPNSNRKQTQSLKMLNVIIFAIVSFFTSAFNFASSWNAIRERKKIQKIASSGVPNSITMLATLDAELHRLNDRARLLRIQTHATGHPVDRQRFASTVASVAQAVENINILISDIECSESKQEPNDTPTESATQLQKAD